MQVKRFTRAIFASLMATLLISTLLMMLPCAVVGSTYIDRLMYAPPLTVPVAVDGVWSAGEWADAPQYTMTNSTGGNVGYIRSKFNSTHLVVIIDSPWDTTPSTVYWHENVWLAFDTNNDGGAPPGAAPQSDDYLVHPTTSWTGAGWVGNGTAWTPYVMSGVSAVQAGENFGAVPLGTSPNSATPHRITEMAVPLTYVGSLNLTVGFYAQVDDDSTDPDGTGPQPATAYSEWPPAAGGTPGWPGQWPVFDPCPTTDKWGKLTAVLYAPPLTVPVTVDGVWSAGEWADAPQYTMTNSTGGNVGYIRAKYDSSKLYVIIDSPWDTTPSTIYYHENVWLAFDTLNDGGNAPTNNTDYLVHPQTSWFGAGWVGNGTAWTPYVMSGVSAVQAGENFGAVPLGTSPNSATPHRITEMAVPLTYVGSDGSTVGFYAQVDDDSTDPDGTGPQPATAYSEWPPAAGGTPGWPGQWPVFDPCPAPNVWGNLRLAVPGMPIWDINGDTVVNIIDIVIVALAFDSERGDPEYDPRGDVRPAWGTINIVDIVFVALHFDEQY